MTALKNLNQTGVVSYDVNFAQRTVIQTTP